MHLSQISRSSALPKRIFGLAIYILSTSLFALCLHTLLPPSHNEIQKSTSFSFFEQNTKHALIEIEFTQLSDNTLKLVYSPHEGDQQSKPYQSQRICTESRCIIRDAIPPGLPQNSEVALYQNQQRVSCSFRLYTLSRFYSMLYARIVLSVVLSLLAIFMIVRASRGNSTEQQKKWRRTHPLQIILFFSCFSFGVVSAAVQLLSDQLSSCSVILIFESIFRYSVLCLVLAQIPKNCEKIRKEKLFRIQHFTFNLLSFLNYIATLMLKATSVSKELKDVHNYYFYSLPSDSSTVVRAAQFLLLVVSLIYSVLLLMSFCRSLRKKPTHSSIIFHALTLWYFPIAMALNVMSVFSNSLLEIQGHLGLQIIVNAYLIGLILFLFSSDLYFQVYPQNFEEIELTKKNRDQQPLPLYDEDDLSQREDDIMKSEPETQHKERAWEIINKIAEKDQDSDSEEDD